MADGGGHQRSGDGHYCGGLVGATVGRTVRIAAESGARRVRRRGGGPPQEGDRGAVEIDLVTGVVEDRDGPVREERVERGVVRFGDLLQQAVEPVEHHRCTGRLLGLDLAEQRRDVVPPWVADVRRDPVRRRLGHHAGEERMTVRLDEPRHQHRVAEVAFRAARRGRTALGE